MFRYVIFLFVGMGFAADSYRWVDKDGVVHFSDKPPAQTQTSQKVTLTELPKLAPRSDEDDARQEQIAHTANAMAQDRAARDQQKQEKAEQKRKQERQCSEAKRNQRILNGPYIPKVTGQNGEVRTLNEQEKAAQRVEVEHFIARYCD